MNLYTVSLVALGSMLTLSEAQAQDIAGINDGGCEFATIQLAIDEAASLHPGGATIFIDPDVAHEITEELLIPSDMTLRAAKSDTNCMTAADFPSDPRAIIFTTSNSRILRIVDTGPIQGTDVILEDLWMFGGNLVEDGGNIYVEDGDLEVINSLINGGTTLGSTNGGGIYVAENETGANQLTLSGGTHIYGNSAAQHGGGVALGAGATLFMQDEAKIGGPGWPVSGNSAGVDGGGVWSQYENIITVVDDAEIYGNDASDDGGGIFIHKSTLELHNRSQIRDNEAEEGGGVYDHFGSTIDLNNQSEISHNDADLDGAGVYMNHSTDLSLMDRSLMDNNDADRNGGSVYADNGSTVTMADGTSIEDSDAVDGGAMYLLDGSSATLTAASLLRNDATDEGGAVYASGDGTSLDVDTGTCDLRGYPSVVCSSISGNSAAEGGAIQVADGASVDIQRTVFDANTSTAFFAGIRVSDAASSLTVANSQFSNHSRTTSGDSGVIGVYKGDADLFGNTIGGNLGGGVYYNATASGALYGNIIHQNASGSFSAGSTGGSCNDIQGGLSGVSAIDVDPGFAGGGDFTPSEALVIDECGTFADTALNGVKRDTNIADMGAVEQ